MVMFCNNIGQMNSDNCCGCNACYSICPTDAIEISKDDEGFDIPVIYNDKCINCGKCIKVCPSHKGKINRSPVIGINGAFSRSDDIRYTSSSGGVFQELGNEFIDDGGYISGCELIPYSFDVKHVVSCDKNDLKLLAGSKYVQSSIGDSLKAISELLKKGKKVLFSGTSCQVNGLMNYLNEYGVDTTNLYTIDLICHGVPSPLILHEYKRFYEEETGYKLKWMRFRTKKYGWGDAIGDKNYIQELYTDDGEIQEISLAGRLWMNCFFSDLLLRPYCYNCPYTTMNKPADLTLGDFWGLEGAYPVMSDKKGCTLVIVHSQKGEKLINNSDMTLFESHREGPLKLQVHLRIPPERPEKRNEFWHFYSEHGFRKAAEKYLNYTDDNKKRYIEKRRLENEGRNKEAAEKYGDILF